MIDQNQIKSPKYYGANIFINEGLPTSNEPISLDVETDEKDNFVSLAVCTGNDVYFMNSLSAWQKKIIEGYRIIAQGGNFDIRMLNKWGVDVDYSHLVYDTKIMAYVYNSNLPTYSLKRIEKGKKVGLAPMFLPDYDWPTYNEMVGTGKKKITLDKQPMEKVAAYNCMDAFVEYKLYKYLNARMSNEQKEYFEKLEMPIYRLLAMMEDKGVMIDVEYIKELDIELENECNYWENELKTFGEFNPRSPVQLMTSLKAHKLSIKSTNIKELTPHKNHPMVATLLKYRKFKKLKSTYVEGFLKTSMLPWIHATFSQDTLTGRLSCAKPNLQNQPAPDPEHKRFYYDVGTKIRAAFIAPELGKLLVLDYSQIEYRLFAHFTQEPILLEAYQNGKDIHQATADLIHKDRRVGKTINFAAIYGAGPKRIAETAGISESEANEALKQYWKALPRATMWINDEKRKAHKYGGITTILGRFIPLPGLYDKNKFKRFHWERVAINAIIQGSAADLIKKAMLDLDDAGYDVRLQVHDELMIYVPRERDHILKLWADNVKKIMIEAILLSVPVEVSGGYGKNWAEAK